MTDLTSPLTADLVEVSVGARYSAAARAAEAQLCCPVDYDPAYLEVIPEEVLEKDYGCGDPSRFVRAGDAVLDLGSGGGKICFIAAQIAGPAGRVIGVDANDDMLALARRHRPAVAAALGYDNVEFRKGRIQDLSLDRELLEAWLRQHPVSDEASLRRFEAHLAWLRRQAPLVADESVDVVLSNCVLNLVADEDKAGLFREVFRVLKRGGRAAISDIVADEPVPAHLKADPELWSGCVSGAMEESEFLAAFERAGFHGMELAARSRQPWRTVEGIQFRSVTVTAWKGKQGECWDHGEAVIYKGPFRQVRDDDGHAFRRGQPVAVCRKTFQILTRPPYAAHFEPVEPLSPVAEPEPFDCRGARVRHPRQTKGLDYDATTEPAACGPSGCC